MRRLGYTQTGWGNTMSCFHLVSTIDINFMTGVLQGRPYIGHEMGPAM